MYATPYPSVLTPDWLPPVLSGRAAELAALSERLGDPYPSRAPPWVATIVGPSGSGTSAVARLAARRLLEAIQREARTVPPALVRVRVAEETGVHGVASRLLQGLDSGFEPRGFPVAEILAGFLRRLARDGRPAVVVLDDIGAGAPDLRPILRALLAPTRFLPEGVETPPTLWTIVAGRVDAEASWSRLERVGLRKESRVELPLPDPATIRAAVTDRAARALGRPAPADLVDRLVSRTLREERGIGRALDLLRRELLGAPTLRLAGAVPLGGSTHVPVEPRILAALERATRGHPTTLGEIRAWEERLAAQEGSRPLPATTLWRRMVRLQAAGVIRRDVRPGGSGGTRSTIELIGPIPYYTFTGPDQTRPGAAGRSAVSRAGASRPAWGSG
ncbi:MAG: hypothetical protein L3K00_07275 [Thermoplasmata archaeon]|nr:hypothetical protein [Thermoplasmata archaeon]